MRHHKHLHTEHVLARVVGMPLVVFARAGQGVGQMVNAVRALTRNPVQLPPLTIAALQPLARLAQDLERLRGSAVAGIDDGGH